MKRTSVAVISSIFLFLGMTVVLDSCGGGGGGGGPAAPVSEGSIANPVNLGTASTTLTHSGSVASYDTSFYKFTTGPTATYTISLTNTKSDLEWSLWSDAGFNISVADCDSFSGAHDEICSVPLAPGTTYYLAVDEWDHVAGTYSITISYSTQPPAPYIAAQVLTWATTPPPDFPVLAVQVCTDWNCNTPIDDAIVTINSTTLTYNGTNEAYEASGPMPAAGAAVDLSVTVPGGWPVTAGTYTASGTQYATVPGLTSPVSGATWNHAANNTVTWTAGSPTTGSAYLVGIMDDTPVFYPTNVNNGPVEVSTASTQYVLPANSITAAGTYYVFVGIGTQGIVAGTGGIALSPSAATGSGLWIGSVSDIVDINVN